MQENKTYGILKAYLANECQSNWLSFLIKNNSYWQK